MNANTLNVFAGSAVAAAPPQNPSEERVRPVIHKGSSDQDCTRILPAGDKTDDAMAYLPSNALMREENPTQAYARIEEKTSIRLIHGGVTWGSVYFAVVCNRIETSSFESATFQAPPRDEAQYVAIKKLRKSIVAKCLASGGKENPYIEIARMQEFGDNIHVLKCIEALEDDDYLYIVTPKACDRGSLVDAIPWGSNERLDIEQVRKWFTQILGILAYLAKHRISHRDISPDNLLFITPERLVAFDLAMSFRMSVAETGQRFLTKPQGNYGTFAYMAPELFCNCAFDGAGTDLWSAAVILYNMLTSQVLYLKPIPTDPCFKYYILARGLSSAPLNHMTMSILREFFDCGNKGISSHHETERQSLLARAEVHLTLPPDAREVLESVLRVRPSDRWTLAQVMGSKFALGKH